MTVLLLLLLGYSNQWAVDQCAHPGVAGSSRSRTAVVHLDQRSDGVDPLFALDFTACADQERPQPRLDHKQVRKTPCFQYPRRALGPAVGHLAEWDRLDRRRVLETARLVSKQQQHCNRPSPL